MNYIKLFSLTSIELISFIIIWSSINKYKALSKARYIIKCSTFILLSVLLVLVLNKLDISSDVPYNAIFSIILLKLLFSEKIANVIFDYFFCTAFCLIIQIVIVAIFNLSKIPLNTDLYYINYLCADLIFFILSIAFSKLLPITKIIEICRKNIAILYFISFNILFYFISIKWMWVNERHQFSTNQILLIIAPLLFIIGNISFTFYSISIHEQKKALDTYNKYVPVITELIDDAKRKQHDFKNHLNTLYGIIQCSDNSNSIDEIKNYINLLSASLHNVESVLHIDNKVLTAIIYNKINEADRNNIIFDYQVQNLSENFSFKSHELSEVLNNLLDNAFEAIIASNSSERKVILRIYNDANANIIEVKNTGNKVNTENIYKIFNKRFTTKNGEGHGYGLYNVKKIVESYNGKIQLSSENLFTVFKLTINDKKSI
jgi:Signal transduction histidine kinase regulating citrate/malate metabolism